MQLVGLRRVERGALQAGVQRAPGQQRHLAVAVRRLAIWGDALQRHPLGQRVAHGALLAPAEEAVRSEAPVARHLASDLVGNVPRLLVAEARLYVESLGDPPRQLF